MIDWLAEHDIDDVVMSCGFLAAEVRAVLGDGDGRLRLRYVEEERPLGTAGAVKHAEPVLDERFAVLNGDILTDFDLGALERFHAERDARATIALIPVEDPSAYGLVRTDASGAIRDFLEKPSPDEIDTDQINAGAYVLERDVLDSIEPGRATSFEREVFPSLIGSGLYGLRVEGYWLDIGTPERYLEATADILEGTVHTVVGSRLGRDRLEVAADASVADEASLRPPALIGGRCRIEPGATVGPESVLGDGSALGEGAVLDHSVLHENVQIGAGATLEEAIVGAGAQIGEQCTVESGAIIGPGAVVGPRTKVSSGDRVEAIS
jgi:mannose-1-phosphate guanylyltransferase